MISLLPVAPKQDPKGMFSLAGCFYCCNTYLTIYTHINGHIYEFRTFPGG